MNNDHRSFGKAHLFDGLDDTCWSSAPSTAHHIKLWLHAQHPPIKAVSFQFQGGQAAKVIRVKHGDEHGQLLYPVDGNNVQVFPLDSPVVSDLLEMEILECFDFYGRITIYQLNLL